MMWRYHYRDGRARLGDADEIIDNAQHIDYESAYREYLEEYFDEVYIMDDYAYSPSELFETWSIDDFGRYASDWFVQTMEDPDDTDLEFLGSIGITPLSEYDINELFESQFGERREFFKTHKPAARRPPTPVERARLSSKGRTSSNSTRSRTKSKTKPKTKPKTKGRC